MRKGAGRLVAERKQGMTASRDAGIIVMGGSFDPIHLGHLIVAERAAELLRARGVIFIPCNIPPHKPAAELAPGRHRFRMVELAIRGNRGFRADDIELRRGGVSYTVETIEALRARLGPRARIWLLIGADSLLELPTWRDYRRLLSLCTVVTAGRPGIEIGARVGRGPVRGGDPARPAARILDTPRIDISSTEIRRRRREGLSIRYMVPRAVERYISSRGLYRGSARRGRAGCRACGY